jgi:hypothetical protein
MAKDKENLFQKLTKLFRSGPVVRRKIRTLDTAVAVADKTKSSGALLFQKSSAPTYATITANAYNLSERLMRYQDFAEMEYCLHGDTKIAVPGGYKTISELASECEGRPDHTFLVYAYDHNLQRIIPALGKQARQTRVDESYKVTFDNGQHIIGTPNHRLMKRDGTFCKIEDLKTGDAMMPFYRRDLFNGCKESGEGYRWIYTMDKRSNMNGWVAEHRVIGEMLKGSPLVEGEVVHHRNFVKHDNRPENLEVMTESDHLNLHAKILNGAKWSEGNSAWIEQFKVNHSKFMTENNPAERKDITFGRILEIAERTGFNSKKMCEVLDTDPNVIKRRLRKHGYQNFETFARAYNPDWHNHGWDNRGEKNPRYVKSITFDKICSNFSKGMSNQQLADSLGTTIHVIEGRIRERGYKNYGEFSSTYDNLKVVSIEPHGVIPLYDLTVDGYKNFATDAVISHNTPELAAALDIYADETCLSGDSIVPLLDGTRPTIKDLYESGREDFWLYSFDTERNVVTPGQATKVVKTGTKKLFRLTFDDGTFLRLTDNHRVLLSNGEYVHARDLKVGESVRSLYTSNSSKESGDKIEGYEKVLNPSGWKYTHRVVSEHFSPDSKGVVHHIDFNKRNNEPSNLRFMSYRDHQLLHASSNSYKWKVDKKYAEKMSDIFRKHALKMHQNPGFTNLFLKRRNEVFAFYDKDTRKRLFGRSGETNGMFERGDLLVGEKNGRRRNDFVRSVSKEQIISWILSGKNTHEVCSSLPIKYEDLHQSMMDAGIKKWSKKYAVDNVDVQQKIKAWIKMQPESNDLNRFLSSACREIGITRKQAYIALESEGYTSWSDYLKRTNHKIISIEEDGTEDVFDLEVKRWHNFATTSSPDSDSFVFVHNCAQDEKGRVLHIYSDNEKIKEILEDLFYNTLNVEFNLRAWVRNLVKYGDMFLYNDVSPEHGVINAFPIPVNEIEREENYDPNDPMAVRYRWVTLGNRTLENWEVSHFRLLGNDMFLPYGSSVIEPARRIWRQLILIEDAMLVYRVVRAPERRVFYIDVANIPPENVPMYVEEQRKNLRSSQVIDRTTGRVDLRYNPLSVDEDYFIPVRGSDSGTRIDTLAGGQNTAAVEDVAYIQKKLFAALKIPRAYLGYDEALSSKATLAQEDIRFSRTINVIQKTMIAELNKLAIIHLYANGFDSEDLQNFALRLSNPSTVAQQQKLELWRAKFEIAGSAPEGQMSKEFIRKEIWGLNDEQCKTIDDQRLKEKMVDQAIESAEPVGGGDAGGGEEEDAGGEEESGGEEEGGAEDLFAGDDLSDKNPYLQLITAGDDPEDEEEAPVKFSLSGIDVPVKAQKQLDRALYNRGRIRHHGPSSTHMPDFKSMTDHDNKSTSDPYDREWMRSYLSNPLGESTKPRYKTSVCHDVMSSLSRMSQSPKFQNISKISTKSQQVLSESDNFEEADAREHREVLIIDDDGSN